MKKISTILMISTVIMLASCKKDAECLQKPGATIKTSEAAAAAPTLGAKFSFTVQDPINIFENQQIHFINESTGAKTCVWEFGNTTKSTSAEPTMSYPMHGYYTVKLTVFDDKGNRQTATTDISILCLYYNGVHPSGTSGSDSQTN